MTRAYATDRFAISAPPRTRDLSITPLGFRQFRLVAVEAPSGVPTYVAMMLIR